MRLSLVVVALFAAAACRAQKEPVRAPAVAECAGPRLTTDGVLMPKALRRVEPDLSACSRSKTVPAAVVTVTIDTAGKVRNFKTVRSSSPCIEKAIADAVHQWTFCPAERDGQPVEATMDIIVNN